MGPRTILVDGYNVIRNTPALAQLEQVSLAAGREAVLARLAARYRHTPHRIVVVFDGDNAAESSQAFPGLSRGRVIFTQRGETADAVILRLTAEARAAGWEVAVVSDDGELRDGARALGGATATVPDLHARLGEAPRHLRKRFTHQAAVKRILSGEDDERRRGDRSKGNPKKSPRKRGQERYEPPI